MTRSASSMITASASGYFSAVTVVSAWTTAAASAARIDIAIMLIFLLIITNAETSAIITDEKFIPPSAEKRQVPENTKRAKSIEIKEIKLSAKTAQNDLNYKVKHALEFIADGKHVRFRVFLKGREMNTPQIGVAMLEKIWEMVSENCELANAPALEGRYVNMLIVPKKG